MSLNLSHQMRARLSDDLWPYLQTISRIAAELSLPIYFVGGIVRDILLDRSSPDLDMVVEGDAIKLAQAVHAGLGGELVIHARFGTANWRPSALPDHTSFDIDFVTARRESYARPAALPDIVPSHIQDDLFRRDFTINTLAVRLDGAYFGQLVDLFNGRADLENGIVRILHDLSFVDDPTRIWRAVRFEQRLSFQIELQTLQKLKRALPYHQELSTDRIRHELELLLAEEDAISGLQRLADLGVWPLIHTQFELNRNILTQLHMLDRLQSTIQAAIFLKDIKIWQMRLWILLAQQPEAALEGIFEQLNVTVFDRESVRLLSRLTRLVFQELEPKLKSRPPSEYVAMLRPFANRPELVQLFGSVSLSADHWLQPIFSTYINEWRNVRIKTNGYTLRQLEVPPGPVYKQILDRLLAERLDEKIVDDAAEHDRLLQLIQELVVD